MEDSFVVSAIKYRPQTFQTVVGQKVITDTLKNSIKSDHLAHAYLFCGPRGVGKTTCARILAKALNCTNRGEDLEPCNACEACTSFNANRSYNIHELDAASNNSVEDIRSLTEQVQIPPQIGRYSVYIIDEVHMLSSAAFNAFLKTLEEPPSYVLFILATTEKHKVLPTILSRCQIFDFNRITILDTISHLKQVAQNEGITVDEETLNVMAQKADGAMRDALSVFDQMVSSCGTNLSYQEVIKSLNVLDKDYYFRMIDFVLAGDYKSSLVLMDEIIRQGFALKPFISGLASHFRELLVAKDSATVKLIETSKSFREKYEEQARRCSDPFLFDGIRLATDSELKYSHAGNKRLLAELLLILLCRQITGSSGNREKPSRKIDSSTPPQKTTAPQRTTSSSSVPNSLNQTIPPYPKANSPAAVLKEKRPSYSPQTSIKQQPSSIQDTTVPPTSTPPPEGEDKEFTQEEFDKVWQEAFPRFVTDVPTRQAIASVSLTEDKKVAIITENAVAETVLKEKLDSLLAYLRKRLQNTQISLVVDVAETSESMTASSTVPKDRYKRMTEKNPQLEAFRKKLGLELQYV